MSRTSSIELARKLEEVGITQVTLDRDTTNWTLPGRKLERVGCYVLFFIVLTMMIVPTFVTFFIHTLWIASDILISFFIEKNNLADGELTYWKYAIVAGLFALSIAISILFQPLPVRLLRYSIALFTKSSTTHVLVDKFKLRATDGIGKKNWYETNVLREELRRLRLLSLVDFNKIQRFAREDYSYTQSLPFPENINYILVVEKADSTLHTIAAAYSQEVLSTLLESLSLHLGLYTEYSSTNTSTSLDLNLSNSQMAVQASRETPATSELPAASNAHLSSTSVFDTLTRGLEDGNSTIPGTILNQGMGLETRDIPNPAVRVPKPANSKITMERREDGIILKTTRRGLWKGSHGMFFFAVVWTTFSLTIFGIATYQIVARQEFGSLLMLLVGSLFVAIGVAMLVFSVHLGTCQSTIATSYGNLFISTESIIHKKTRSIEVERLRQLSVGPSGIEVNDRPVLQLRVELTDGTQLGFLSHLPTDELQWITYELTTDIAQHI